MQSCRRDANSQKGFMFASCAVHLATVNNSDEETKSFRYEKETNMRTIRNLAVIAIAAITFALLAPNAEAQIPLQKIRVTISEPVEVPNMVLPIGTYIFEAIENGRMTRILSSDESHIYTTVLTQPDERREPLDNPVVTLSESPKGQVPRIDSWFFAGESIGNEFLYAGIKIEGAYKSRLDALTKETGHFVAQAAEDAVEAPEYAAVHVERAVVGSSVATGPFFRANFLVN
jgi:hypothetical protein